MTDVFNYGSYRTNPIVQDKGSYPKRKEEDKLEMEAQLLLSSLWIMMLIVRKPKMVTNSLRVRTVRTLNMKKCLRQVTPKPWIWMTCFSFPRMKQIIMGEQMDSLPELQLSHLRLEHLVSHLKVEHLVSNLKEV